MLIVTCLINYLLRSIQSNHTSESKYLLNPNNVIGFKPCIIKILSSPISIENSDQSRRRRISPLESENCKKD
uniref:Putative ovule protein n=1 Tax=Solanum chacoense TaxID=4108 RepID=A0A0V0I104_SOLCH